MALVRDQEPGGWPVNFEGAGEGGQPGAVAPLSAQPLERH